VCIVTLLHETPTETPAPPESKPALPVGRLLFGGVLVAIGLVWMAERLDWFEFAAGMLLPVALTIVGVGLIAGAFSGSHPGLITLGVVLTVLTVISAFAPFEGFRGGVGDRTIAVTSASSIESPYRLAVGNLVLDLRRLDITGPTEVTANVGVGKLSVLVPAGTALEISGDAGIGEVDFFGDTWSGVGLSHKLSQPGAKDTLTLDLGIAIGEVEVSR
jgi:hypothetical protein